MPSQSADAFQLPGVVVPLARDPVGELDLVIAQARRCRAEPA